jgi:hypothetical protein
MLFKKTNNNYKDFEEPEQKKLGYLEKYYDKKIEKSSMDNKTSPKWFDDSRELIGLYKYDSSYDTIVSKNKWANDTLQDFLFNIYEYQDPTYLGYDLMLITDESPLFNFDASNNLGEPSTALKFIQKYGEISEIANRELLLSTFLNQLTKMFAATPDSQNQYKSDKKFYIEDISGLDKLSNKIVKYGEDILELTLNEDVSLRTQYLMELYKNLIYDYKNKREMIPENTLRFNMVIKISDIRDFKVENPNYDINKKREEFVKLIPNAGETFFMYKLYDCNFIFENVTHEGNIAMGGWQTFNTSNMNNTKIKIKYKSVSRIFQSY